MGKKKNNKSKEQTKPPTMPAMPRTSYDDATDATDGQAREKAVAEAATTVAEAAKLADEVDKLVAVMQPVAAKPVDPFADCDDDEIELERLKRTAMENRKKRQSFGYKEKITEELKGEIETPAAIQLKVALTSHTHTDDP